MDKARYAAASGSPKYVPEDIGRTMMKGPCRRASWDHYITMQLHHLRGGLLSEGFELKTQPFLRMLVKCGPFRINIDVS
jgi:hypothetical protein